MEAGDHRRAVRFDDHVGVCVVQSATDRLDPSVDDADRVAVSQRARDDLVTVFILPPSMGDLATRLKSRAQDSVEVVAARMAKAEGEISHWSEYDYVLVNDDVEACAQSLQHIIEAERLKRERQVWLLDFVRSLTGQKG